jgi:hypothetical protein
VKLRSLFSLLTTTAIALLAIAGVSLYWILVQSPLQLLQGGVNREPAAAVFVSKQSPVMLSLLVKPERLEAFAQLTAAPQNRRRSRQQLQEVEKSLLANTGLNYEREIRPWLGNEITLAVTSLDFDRLSENGAKPGYLLAVQAKDRELAKEFLQLSYSQQALSGTSDLVFADYKGANLIYKRPRGAEVNTNFLASAVVADFVLFANEPRVLRDAINNVQVADLNLKNAPAYREALKTIPEPRIGIAYGNLPALSAWIANLPVPETPEITQALAVSLSLKSQGLVAETALSGVSGSETESPALSQPVGALAYVPANSIVTAAGTNLNQFWQQAESGLAADSPLQQLLQRGIERLQQPLGLDLPQDVFAWVRGEYSLAAVPNLEGGDPDWIFIAEKVPGVAVETAIAHLDELAQSQGYSVGQLPLLEKSVTAWTKLKAAPRGERNLARVAADVRGVHWDEGKYAIFATSFEAMSQAISAAQEPLIESQKFQRAIAALPTENDGYFYLDWNQSEPLIEAKFPAVRVVGFAIKPILDNLRSLTLSSEGSQAGIRRATAYLNLGVR